MQASSSEIAEAGLRWIIAQSRISLGRPSRRCARVKPSPFHQQLSSHPTTANHHHLSPASVGQCFVVLSRWTINEPPKGPPLIMAGCRSDKLCDERRQTWRLATGTQARCRALTCQMTERSAYLSLQNVRYWEWIFSRPRFTVLAACASGLGRDADVSSLRNSS